MSTVISKGYMIPSNDLNFIFRTLSNLKEMVAKQAQKKFIDAFAEQLMEVLPGYLFGAENTEYDSLKSEMNAFLKEQNPDDFSAKVFLFPLAHKTLMLSFSPMPADAEEELFTTLTPFQSYSYWNNSDREKGVSPEEWNQRAKDWRPFTHTSVDQTGFQFYLYKPLRLTSFMRTANWFQEVSAHIGDFDAFKYRIAYHQTMISFKLPEGIPISQFNRHFYTFKETIEQDDRPVQELLSTLNFLKTWDDVYSFFTVQPS